jgi:hypothetical protein
MSIDGIIKSVTRVGDDLDIQIKERVPGQPTGQDSFLILDFVHVPSLGSAMWGGSDTVILEEDPKVVYDRIGYTRLRERKPKSAEETR